MEFSKNLTYWIEVVGDESDTLITLEDKKDIIDYLLINNSLGQNAPTRFPLKTQIEKFYELTDDSNRTNVINQIKNKYNEQLQIFNAKTQFKTNFSKYIKKLVDCDEC